MTSAVIQPQSKFQSDYLNSSAKILVVGGAAGSSKSYIGLMRHLRWAEDPNYRGFCIRKNSTAIMKSGGLFQEAVKLYSLYDPKIKIKTKDQKIVFSSGAEVSFSHYENRNAAQLYQGLQLSNCFYDEASHAEEEDIWWLFSRLRTDADVTPSIWLSCNPDPDSYLFEWVKWWLYDETSDKHGLPDPEKNGVTRYLIRQGGVIFWGDSPEELKERYGEHVFPISFQVLLGTIYDNPTLMRNQPEYLHALEALPKVDRARLLLGDWTARAEGSGYFKREWMIEELDDPPHNEIVKTVRVYDLAGTLKSDLNYNPDYSTSCKMSKLKNGEFFIHEVERWRSRYGELMSRIISNANRDGTKVDIIIPQDPNASAKAAAQMMVKDITAEGFYVKAVSTNRSKLDNFRPFSASSMNGNVRIKKNCGNDFENKIFNSLEFFYDELEKFDGESRTHHDDLVDCVSGAFMDLARKMQIPSFSMPSMTKSNEFSF